MHVFIRLSKSAFLVCLIVCVSIFATGCPLEGSDSSGKLGASHDFGDNNPDVVLAMGDSITAGGFSGEAAWPARLGGMVGKSVVNAGIPGAPASVGAGRIGGLLQSRKPGFVIIFYGSNDAIQGVDINTTENAIRAMVIRAKNNQSIPLLATALPMTGGRQIFNGGVDRINGRIRAIANSESVKLVNLHGAIRRNPDLYLVDGLHLSGLGEELVAMEFMDALN